MPCHTHRANWTPFISRESICPLAVGVGPVGSTMRRASPGNNSYIHPGIICKLSHTKHASKQLWCLCVWSSDYNRISIQLVCCFCCSWINCTQRRDQTQGRAVMTPNKEIAMQTRGVEQIKATYQTRMCQSIVTRTGARPQPAIAALAHRQIECQSKEKCK